jgi:hypothetical protein
MAQPTLLLGQTLEYLRDPFAGEPALAARHTTHGAVLVETGGS